MHIYFLLKCFLRRGFEIIIDHDGNEHIVKVIIDVVDIIDSNYYGVKYSIILLIKDHQKSTKQSLQYQGFKEFRQRRWKCYHCNYVELIR